VPRPDLDELIRLNWERFRSRRSQERLPTGPVKPTGKDRAALWIELGEDVVEQQQRAGFAPLRQEIGLCEQKRENRETLLTLRAEAAQVTSAGGDSNIVEMRSESG
jgi:hypothetical protein